MRQTTYQILGPEKTLSMPLTGIKLIEASAGTGKTYTIANLYLRYILNGKKGSEILVVTFTKAATDELKSRIQQRLLQMLRLLKTKQIPTDDLFLQQLIAELQNNNETDHANDLLQLAVRSMETTAIFTIHGFCQRALTDHAFFSQQPFEVNVATDDSELWQDALKDWWRKNSYHQDEITTALLAAALKTTENFIRLQRNLRDSNATLLPACDTSKEALFNEWKALESTFRHLQKTWQKNKAEIEQILTSSKALARGKKTYKKDTLIADLITLNKYFNSEKWYVLPANFKKYTSQGLEDGSTKTKRGTDEILNEYPFFKLCQQAWDTFNDIKHRLLAVSLKDATEFAREHVNTVKQRSQTISFNDQLTRLQNALTGETGDALSKSLRKHFPIAMIDEFQDTDTIQYDIFRHIYHNAPAEENNTGLLMIGDPKQAIYKFRGGDIFTYIQAKDDVSDFYTLDTNWRSTPGIVKSTNTIFSNRTKPFIFDDAFTYTLIKAAKKGSHLTLTENDIEAPPVTLWPVPIGHTQAGKNSLTTKKEASRLSVEKSASEIALLIKSGSNRTALLGNKPVKPADIAVLVRTHYDGDEIRKALQKRGIQSVTIGKENIYHSDEYRGLQRLLKAIFQYSDRFTARAALSISLLNNSYTDIADIINHETRWLDWIGKLQKLNRLWQKDGFMVMFQSMLHELEIGTRLANTTDAERKLTNLIHLAELIQQASRSHSGIDALYNWLIEKADDPDAEESELRLESDKNLVQIVTIHKSKGLEYPIVFLPFMWSCRGFKDKDVLVKYHNDQNNAFIHSNIADDENAADMARNETLAEEIRLAYVALTRASSKIYLSWGATSSKGCSSIDTGLGYLLHEGKNKDDIKDETALPDIEKLVSQSDCSIVLEKIVDGEFEEQHAVKATYNITDTGIASFSGTSKSDWRVASFSSLTRDVHQAPHGGSIRTGEDEIFDFPAGSHVGLFLHHILEFLDFSGDITAQTQTIMKGVAVRYDLDLSRHGDTVQRWMKTLLATSLDGKGLTLGGLTQAQRLNEMGFDFSTHKVDIDSLNRLLNNTARQVLSPVTHDTFSGMVTGFIDLIFEYQGKYYVSDYKSNYLGSALTDYTQEKLEQAIYERRYDLQYLIYTLALHRYLKTRIKDYDYETHIGGVYYLFLRAMRKEYKNKYGTYYNKPEKTLIEALDRIFSPESQ